MTNFDGAFHYPTKASEAQKEKILRADHLSQRYLGDYNERVERLGREDVIAVRLYEKGQYWLDRYNKLVGNG